METIVGRKALFNPIFNGGIHYSNGIEVTPCVKNIQVLDQTIIGIIVEDRQADVFISGPIEPDGWFPVFLMSKQLLTLLRTGQQNVADSQIGS